MKIDVWILSRYDGRGLFALAFPSADKLIEYVQDYYYEDGDGLPPLPADGDDLNGWLGNLAEAFGYVFAIDHDIMEVGEVTLSDGTA